MDVTEKYSVGDISGQDSLKFDFILAVSNIHFVIQRRFKWREKKSTSNHLVDSDKIEILKSLIYFWDTVTSFFFKTSSAILRIWAFATIACAVRGVFKIKPINCTGVKYV